MQQLLEQAVKAGIQRVVYVSSAHVYGPLEGELTEATPANPLGLYGMLHYTAEQMIRRYVHLGKIQALILRPCAVYGPLKVMERFNRWSLIPFAFPKEAIEQGTITLQSDGSQRRNFVSSQAIAELVLTCLRNASAEAWTVWNAVGPEEETVYDFAKRCAGLAERLTSQPCRVMVPAGVPAGASPENPPLRYVSCHGTPREGASLDEVLTVLMQQLGAHEHA